MKRCILASLMASLPLMVASALALEICDDTPNCVGIYFDEGVYEDNCLLRASPFVLHDFYFVVKSCDLDQIGGFELAWRMEPQQSIAPVTDVVQPQGLAQTLDPYNMIARFEEPVVGSDPFVLAQISLLFFTEPYVLYFYTGPSEPATMAAHAVIFSGDDLADPIPLHLGTTTGEDGWTDNPVAAAGGPCSPDPIESATWGSVKALYR